MVVFITGPLHGKLPWDTLPTISNQGSVPAVRPSNQLRKNCRKISNHIQSSSTTSSWVKVIVVLKPDESKLSFSIFEYNDHYRDIVPEQ